MSRYSSIKGIVIGLNTAINLCRLFDVMENKTEAIKVYRELLETTLAPFEQDMLELREYYAKEKEYVHILSDSGETGNEEELPANHPGGRETEDHAEPPVQTVREGSHEVSQSGCAAD